jgi:hypothetical protein
MRKIVTLAAIAALMVATLRAPVRASLTPWGNSNPGDEGGNNDHPWGGDGKDGGGGVPGGSPKSGNPSVDIVYQFIIKPFFIGTQSDLIITTVLSKKNTSTSTKQNGTGAHTSNSVN